MLRSLRLPMGRGEAGVWHNRLVQMDFIHRVNHCCHFLDHNIPFRVQLLLNTKGALY
jgi:hypothetical protein